MYRAAIYRKRRLAQRLGHGRVAVYEQTLEDIKNGLLVSKSVNGDDECMTTFNPDWVGSTTD